MPEPVAEPPASSSPPPRIPAIAPASTRLTLWAWIAALVIAAAIAAAWLDARNGQRELRGELAKRLADNDAAQQSTRAIVKDAQENLRDAQAKIALLENRLGESQAQQAALDNAKLQLSYTEVTAPETGTISKKQVEIGQLVQPGQTMMSIVADTGTWVTANFKETQLNQMVVAQPVTFEIDAYPGCEAEGKVQSLSGATGARFALLPPDNATGNFTKVVQRLPVRIAVTKGCGSNRPLRPGMSVVAHVDTKKE